MSFEIRDILDFFIVKVYCHSEGVFIELSVVKPVFHLQKSALLWY
jgi:hypothetical protein